MSWKMFLLLQRKRPFWPISTNCKGILTNPTQLWKKTLTNPTNSWKISDQFHPNMKKFWPLPLIYNTIPVQLQINSDHIQFWPIPSNYKEILINPDQSHQHLKEFWTIPRIYSTTLTNPTHIQFWLIPSTSEEILTNTTNIQSNSELYVSNYTHKKKIWPIIHNSEEILTNPIIYTQFLPIPQHLKILFSCPSYLMMKEFWLISPICKAIVISFTQFPTSEGILTNPTHAW